jgi:hypothetical protein
MCGTDQSHALTDDTEHLDVGAMDYSLMASMMSWREKVALLLRRAASDSLVAPLELEGGYL